MYGKRLGITMLLVSSLVLISCKDAKRENINMIESTDVTDGANAIENIEEPIEKQDKEQKEQYPEIMVENMKDVKRGENLNYENCYTTEIHRGSNHYWIDEEGNLWGEGTSEYGQLGILKQDLSMINEPVKIAESVIHVDFSGEYFVIYITEDKKLYGLGGNPAGILNFVERENFNAIYMNAVTEPVQLLEGVVFAKCGYSTIITLQESGDVYVMGNNHYAPFQNEDFKAPKKFMEHAKYVTSYYNTFAAIDEDNTLWAWGKNDHGQCGIEVCSAPVEKPMKVMEEVDCVWMGRMGFNFSKAEDTKDILIVQKKDGNFYGCGVGFGEERIVKGQNDLVEEEQVVADSANFVPISLKEHTRK